MLGKLGPYPGSRCRVKVWAVSADAADIPWGDIMKFIIEVEFPLEPFNTYVVRARSGIGSARWSALSSPRSSTSLTAA
jgi:hypothetical protein